MKEGKEAGKVLEVRWGRQSMNVAGMKVKNMTTFDYKQSGDCERAKRGKGRGGDDGMEKEGCEGIGTADGQGWDIWSVRGGTDCR